MFLLPSHGNMWPDSITSIGLENVSQAENQCFSKRKVQNTGTVLDTVIVLTNSVSHNEVKGRSGNPGEQLEASKVKGQPTGTEVLW